MKELTVIAMWGAVFIVVFRFAEAYYTRLQTYSPVALWPILVGLVMLVAIMQIGSAMDTAAWRRRNQNDRNR